MNNKAYKCAVCGKMHSDIISRANCEISCTEKQEEEKRLAELRKKEAEYKTRKEEVDNAFKVAYELREKFVADYGNYEFSWGSNRTPNIWRFLA